MMHTDVLKDSATQHCLFKSRGSAALTTLSGSQVFYIAPPALCLNSFIVVDKMSSCADRKQKPPESCCGTWVSVTRLLYRLRVSASCQTQSHEKSLRTVTAQLAQFSRFASCDEAGNVGPASGCLTVVTEGMNDKCAADIS